MKSAIFSGRVGYSIFEDTLLKSKLRIEISGKPILWHMMKIYSKYSINELIIYCSYKRYLKKNFFQQFPAHV
jgi:glucose-1-phosphate cytidylyltransferase